jgi:glycerol-3-phosphate acyltransferase PlsY
MEIGQLAGGICLIVLAYLAGAIPSGVVLGRLFGGGVDLRGHGSGSIGTTNALRVFGWRISVGVLVMDLLKGALPVIVGRLLDVPVWALALSAVAATVGHCWSIFIKGTGGKGVATGGAAIMALTPWALLAIPLMLVIVALTRYVSLASLVIAALAPPFFLVLALLGQLSWWIVLATSIISAIIIFKHWGNIDRLRSGTERKIGQRTSAAAATQGANASA